MSEFLHQPLAFFPIDEGPRSADRPDALLQLRDQITGALLGGEQQAQLFAQDGFRSRVLDENASESLRSQPQESVSGDGSGPWRALAPFRLAGDLPVLGYS